jgi:hypothetical protein
MPHTDRVHTPDNRLAGLTGLGRREVGRRGLLLAAPVGLLALATGDLGSSLLAPVGRAGSAVYDDARGMAESVLGPARVRSALDAALLPIVGRSSVIGVSVLDRRTGTSWNYRGDSLVQTGSVSKVLVVAAALRKARAAGTSLSSRQLEQVRLAITRSDNASADALYAYIGGHQAVARLAADLDMSATASADKVPHWGNTLTTANDLVILMTALAGGTPVLDAKDRAVILQRMAEVVEGQRWGVGTVGTSNVKVRVKNGWMRVDNPWVINSVGDVLGGGRDYVLAMLQRAQPDEETGMTRASRIGRAVFTALAP